MSAETNMNSKLEPTRTGVSETLRYEIINDLNTLLYRVRKDDLKDAELYWLSDMLRKFDRQ